MKHLLQQPLPSFGGIRDITFVQGTFMFSCLTKGFMKLELINGPCVISVKEIKKKIVVLCLVSVVESKIGAYI